jgi:hypothetical protein
MLKKSYGSLWILDFRSIRTISGNIDCACSESHDGHGRIRSGNLLRAYSEISACAGWPINKVITRLEQTCGDSLHPTNDEEQHGRDIEVRVSE